MPTTKVLMLICAITIVHVTARESDERVPSVTQFKIGNLAVSGSQQPGSLIGFGQNIVNKKDIQSFLYTNCLHGKHKNFTEVIPSILYGIRNDLSLFVQLPIAAQFSSNGRHSSGIQDLSLQLEYAWHATEKETYTNQCTLVTALFLPTGNDHKEPTTGFGSPSFFLGLTAYHIGTEWYYYASPAVLVTTHHKKSKAGNQYLYQAGFGKNIAYKTDQWILTWLLEFTGTYTQKRKLDGVIDQNSGGNVILLTPSLWFSTEKLIFQCGIAPVVYQHNFGTQLKNSFQFTCNIGWKF